MKDNKRRKFKAQVALEAVKERKTLAELAQEFNRHPNQISGVVRFSRTVILASYRWRHNFWESFVK